jgi:ATP-dependent Clp protease ATP-binding subunit ClpA
VGKSAIAEGLAQVFKSIKNFVQQTRCNLATVSLVAGTKYRGQLKSA